MKKNYQKIVKNNKAGKSEATVVKEILQYLNSLDQTYAEKREATPGRKGRVDITGCHRGIRIEIEAKRPDDNAQPTKIQLYWLGLWQEVGAITGVAKSVEDIIKIMDIKI